MSAETLVNFTAAFTLAADESIDASTSLDDLRGDLRVTIDSWSQSLGLFPGAVLLLATAESLLSDLSLLRRKRPSVELLIVGDVGPVWLHRVGRDDRYAFGYRGERSPAVDAEVLIEGFRQATAALLGTFLGGKPWPDWTPAEKSALRRLVAGWSADDPALHELRRVGRGLT